MNDSEKQAFWPSAEVDCHHVLNSLSYVPINSVMSQTFRGWVADMTVLWYQYIAWTLLAHIIKSTTNTLMKSSFFWV